MILARPKLYPIFRWIHVPYLEVAGLKLRSFDTEDRAGHTSILAARSIGQNEITQVPAEAIFFVYKNSARKLIETGKANFDLIDHLFRAIFHPDAPTELRQSLYLTDPAMSAALEKQAGPTITATKRKPATTAAIKLLFEAAHQVTKPPRAYLAWQGFTKEEGSDYAIFTAPLANLPMPVKVSHLVTAIVDHADGIQSVHPGDLTLFLEAAADPRAPQALQAARARYQKAQVDRADRMGYQRLDLRASSSPTGLFFQEIDASQDFNDLGMQRADAKKSAASIRASAGPSYPGQHKHIDRRPPPGQRRGPGGS